MASVPQLTTDVAAPQEWKDLLEDMLPPQGEWSEEEYLVLTDHRNRLIEYTDGFVEPLPMPTDLHQRVRKLLFLAFHHFIDPRGGTVLFAPFYLVGPAGG